MSRRRSLVFGFLGVIATLGGGCGSLHQYATPMQPELGIAMHPHVASYELLAVGQGKACRSIDELNKMVRWAGLPKTDDKWIGSRFLYEEAKYAAIESIRADNLMFIRTRAEMTNDDVCVYVTGRGYRVLSMKAVAPLGEEAPPAAATAAHP